MSRYTRLYAERLAPATGLPADEVERVLAAPPRPELGQLAFGCFALAKTRRKAPAAIAAEVAPAVALGDGLLSVTAEGPYVNAHLDGADVARHVLTAVAAQGERYGELDLGRGGTVPVDFSSPNIAKPFGIHHLRSTVIGHALVGMLQAGGYRPVGINHIGDWGTQFGQLLAAWEEQGDEAELASRGIAYLLELYVEFNRKAKETPQLAERARAKFKALEDGDPEARRLWGLFRDVSLSEFERVYALLGIHFDDVRGESHYEDMMPAVLEELAQRGLLKESENATIVDLEEHGLGAALVRKRDGTTLYLTRDLAAADHRFRTYEFVRCLYVVGAAQSLHFKQLRKVLELLGRPWADRVEHVPFGMMRFKDRKMATRTGDVVLLEDVLDRAVALARQTIERGAAEKGRELPTGIDELAHRIGVGAVVFNDLKNRRIRDVVFDWDEVLSFEGETGPYLQYTAARIASMGDRYGRRPPTGVRWELLSGEGEMALLLSLDALPDSLARGLAEAEPSLVADRLLDIAARFSTLYARKDWKVLSADAALSDARMLLATATRQALVNGLTWLGIPVPERM
ncbi:MAG: arginine--tRNA ligase [Planctomycetota bacterium]|jgi:arginyl-tRNA synthetase